MLNKRQRGLTLVELIIAMVIIGAGLAGVLGALMRTSVFSANPMITKQMGAIAEGMMDEVLLHSFLPVPTAPGDTPNTPCARNTFNDLLDYNGYNSTPVCDVDGTATTGLAGYGVNVTVLQTAAGMGGVAAADILEVTVTVTNGPQNYTLRGWRTRY